MVNGNLRRVLILSVVVLAVVGAVALRGGNDEEADSGPAVVKTAPALPRLLDLGADKCIPCKAMVPVLAELETGLAGQLEVVFLDVWQSPDAAKPYRIKLIPTQIFFDPQGAEIFRHEGFFGRDEILAEWERLGYKFTLASADEG